MKRFGYGVLAWIGGMTPLTALRYSHDGLVVWLASICGFILLSFAYVKTEDMK